ncbi:MAG: hypothetical protein HFI70_10760 [Lachnospiraceae bacterium]|nr:hypothetical protein [Lachnospiraceae bacterium]
MEVWALTQSEQKYTYAQSMTTENRTKGLVEIRDCVRKLIQYQTNDYPEEMIQTGQKNLNRLYDAFTKIRLNQQPWELSRICGRRKLLPLMLFGSA